MKPIPAIVESAVEQHAAAVLGALKYYREAEGGFVRARDALARMRLNLGRELVAARGLWPARGPKSKGWGEFLARFDLDQDVALDAMKYAGYVEAAFPGDVPGNLPTLAEADIDNRPRKAGEIGGTSSYLAPGQSPEVEIEIDRDTWCTPEWITTAIGKWDLDPCGNERSHVQAETTFDLDRRGEDGLVLAADVHHDERVFINPPYSDVMPWVQAYGRTRFCFLLKFDPSTKWFAELYSRTRLICIPKGTRVQFEAPPGVPKNKSEANQFPHALFFANPDDATDRIRQLCFCWLTQSLAA